MKSKIKDTGKILGGMKVFSCRAMGMNVKRGFYVRVDMSFALYGSCREDEIKSNVDEVSE